MPHCVTRLLFVLPARRGRIRVSSAGLTRTIAAFPGPRPLRGNTYQRARPGVDRPACPWVAARWHSVASPGVPPARRLTVDLKEVIDVLVLLVAWHSSSGARLSAAVDPNKVASCPGWLPDGNSCWKLAGQGLA